MLLSKQTCRAAKEWAPYEPTPSCCKLVPAYCHREAEFKVARIALLPSDMPARPAKPSTDCGRGEGANVVLVRDRKEVAEQHCDQQSKQSFASEKQRSSTHLGSRGTTGEVRRNVVHQCDELHRRGGAGSSETRQAGVGVMLLAGVRTTAG